MKNFFPHLRAYILRGLLAVIPLLLCALAIQLLLSLIDQRVLGFLSQFIEDHKVPGMGIWLAIIKIPGMGIVLLLICLYLVGLVVSNYLGRRVFTAFENITQRIPFIKTIYGVGKQLSQGLSLADGEQTFKDPILVKLRDESIWAPAFVMSSTKDPKTNEELLFVLIPTAPNPVSGYVLMVKASETIRPGWTVEECLKMIISLGIISPKNKNGNS